MILVTGSGGLIGSEAAEFYSKRGKVIGIDNDLRKYFFGKSVNWRIKQLCENKNYTHYNIDIRDVFEIENIFLEHGSKIDAIIHCAAQPSHDWAANEPITDFSVNAVGTLNLLEFTRKYCPEASFIFVSTNKVYGDSPNSLPLVENETRFSHVDPNFTIDENMQIDKCLHSLFGVSKASADLLVQEYGKYFGVKTVCFRGGCLTGPNHTGAELHGFLSYLVHCAVHQKSYTVFGYSGKQVRDNIHSSDLILAFDNFLKNPRSGEVYNMGGGKYSNVSMLEAIEKVDQLTGRKLNFTISNSSRKGDHMWYISNLEKFTKDYPEWRITRGIDSIIEEMVKSEWER